MVYVVKGLKVGVEAVCVCKLRKTAEAEALKMLDQGYIVSIIQTPLMD